MPNNTERPFGRNTLKLHAVFVPEGAEDEISHAEIRSGVGSTPLMVPAVLVPEGGQPPRHPYINAGEFEFRPEEGNQSVNIVPSWQQIQRPVEGSDQGSVSSDATTVPAATRNPLSGE